MDFVIIANAWGAARDNPTGKHQIALQLAQKGHRVLWIEGSGMRKPSAGNASDRSRIQTKLKLAAKGIRKVQNNIWVTAPVILPLPSSSAARLINSIIYTLAGIWARIRLHLHKPTLINFLPTVPATEKLWPWKSVYFCVDRWEKFEMYDTKVMQHVDRQCCLNADIVLTTSHELLELCRRKNEQSILIGHGVNWQRFNTPLTAKQNGSAKQRPADLPDGSIVGFFGLLSEWVDQNLLIKLARSLADPQNGKTATLVLIGKADVDIEALRSEPNIHILGSKPFNVLPDYTVYFDVAIIPFVVNELTTAVNPIKLREFLAAGCPVVSSALPEVEQIAHNSKYIKTTGNDADFISSVQAWLDQAPTAAERLEISSSVSNETWSAKVDLILASIGAEKQ